MSKEWRRPQRAARYGRRRSRNWQEEGSPYGSFWISIPDWDRTSCTILILTNPLRTMLCARPSSRCPPKQLKHLWAIEVEVLRLYCGCERAVSPHWTFGQIYPTRSLGLSLASVFSLRFNGASESNLFFSEIQPRPLARNIILSSNFSWEIYHRFRA